MKIKIKIEKKYIIDSFYTTMRIYTDKSVIAYTTMDRIYLKCDQIENKNNSKQFFILNGSSDLYSIFLCRAALV